MPDYQPTSTGISDCSSGNLIYERYTYQLGVNYSSDLTVTEPWNHGDRIRGMILFFMALPQSGEKCFFNADQL